MQWLSAILISLAPVFHPATQLARPGVAAGYTSTLAEFSPPQSITDLLTEKLTAHVFVKVTEGAGSSLV